MQKNTERHEKSYKQKKKYTLNLQEPIIKTNEQQSFLACIQILSTKQIIYVRTYVAKEAYKARE